MKKPYVVIDTETNHGAIKGELTDLFCVGLYFPDTDEELILSGHPSEYQHQLQTILDERIPIFHNSTFDIWVLESMGLEVTDFEDTMLMSYCCYPSESHSLESWGIRLNYPKLDFKDFTGYSEEMGKYCINDCKLTWKVFEALDGKVPPIYLVDRDFVRIIIEMQTNGVQIDENAFDEVISSIEQEIIPIKEAIDKLAPVALSAVYKRKTEAEASIYWNTYEDLVAAGEGSITLDKFEDDLYHYRKVVKFNPNSSDHIAFVLEHLYGWKPSEFTPSGKPKTDKDTLKELPYELANLLVTHSKYAKLVSTYGESMKSFIKNGRLHTNYNNCVTKTGRLSSSSPNLN